MVFNSKAYFKKYYKKNKEKINKQIREWQERNKEYLKEYWKRKQQTPEFREKRKLYYREYRKGRKEGINAAILFAHRYFEKESCRLCGTKNNLEFHHIKYTNKPEDVLVLCKQCHEDVHHGKKSTIGIKGELSKMVKIPNKVGRPKKS